MFPNLRILLRDTVTISGVRFVGCTLWYDAVDPDWSDFRHIRGGWTELSSQHQYDTKFLRQNVQEGDVVVTHMLPSWMSVHPRYAGDNDNRFFVVNQEELMDERSPSLWLHGHTHDSFDYVWSKTRVVCNPLGYVAMGETNSRFDENLIIEKEV